MLRGLCMIILGLLGPAFGVMLIVTIIMFIQNADIKITCLIITIVLGVVDSIAFFIIENDG